MGSPTDGLTALMLAALFGGMVLFPIVVAPTVFKVLEAGPASQFLRALFPRYYAFIIVASATAAGLVLVQARPIAALALGFICISTIFVRQVLVPKINAWRDAGEAGNTRAGTLFDIAHRFTVVLNMIQLLLVTAAIIGWL